MLRFYVQAHSVYLPKFFHTTASLLKIYMQEGHKWDYTVYSSLSKFHAEIKQHRMYKIHHKSPTPQTSCVQARVGLHMTRTTRYFTAVLLTPTVVLPLQSNHTLESLFMGLLDLSELTGRELAQSILLLSDSQLWRNIKTISCVQHHCKAMKLILRTLGAR